MVSNGMRFDVMAREKYGTLKPERVPVRW